MTNQEFFDAFVIHLRKQGRQAKREYGGCTYDNGQGLYCGVGGVMTPELRAIVVARNQNRMSIGELMDNNFETHTFFLGVSRSLLAEAQRLHDAHSPDTWEHQFRLLAHRFSLEVPKC